MAYRRKRITEDPKARYKLYKMEYNWFGDTGTLYRHAWARANAWYAFTTILARKYDTSFHRVHQHLKEGFNAIVREVDHD